MVPAHRLHDISDNLWELLNLICRDVKEQKTLLPEITDCSSMHFFGFYELVLHGATCHRNMATGKTHIADFADDGTMGFGKSFLKSLLMNRILNG